MTFEDKFVIPKFNDTLMTPQFLVEHRVKTVFDKPPDVHHYSLGMVAAQVSKTKKKYNTILDNLKMQVTESGEPQTSALQQEDLDNMFSNLNFRFNDANLLSPGDQSRDHSRSRASSPATPRTPTELLSPGGTSRSGGSSPTTPRSPCHRGFEGRSNTGSLKGKSPDSDDAKTRRSTSDEQDDECPEMDHTEPIGEVIDKLKKEKKVKDEGKGSGSSKHEGRKPKVTRKKKTAHGESVDQVTSKVRTKLVSVHTFQEGRKKAGDS